MRRTAIVWAALLGAALPLSAQEKPAWPAVPKVEAQPLLAQARRVAQALDFLGQPLPADAKKALDALKVGDGDDKVAATVQKLFDPLCVAAVEIAKDGTLKAASSPSKPELIEQGWRLVLVKVINHAGSTGALRVDSPNARDIPRGPKDEVETRWLGLSPWLGQPLLPTLGGLELEYVALQMYSKDAGQKTATLNFRLESGRGGQAGPVVKDWRFDKDEAGWKATNHATTSTEKATLVVKSTGNDPQLVADVEAPQGNYVLRFWGQFDQPGQGQLFWRNKGQDRFAGDRVVNFRIDTTQPSEYAIRLRVGAAELAGLRLDPGNTPGTVRIDWIQLTKDDPGAPSASAPVTVDAKPCVPVTFRVLEEDGTEAMAGFLIRDEANRVYPAQSKRLAPDFFFHPQVYRATSETVRLPAGKYTIRCTRGPESIPETKTVTVGKDPVTVVYQVKRWSDPAKRGWYSGDHHIHAAGCQHYENPTEGVHPPDMMRHILGEDLKVGCCLTWGPCFDYQKRFFTGKPDAVSKPPYLLRYDVEVSGFGSHQSGHLCLLDLKEQIPAGGLSKDHWPTLGMNTLRWAKKQGAVTGPAHSGNGLTRAVGRIDGKDGPNGLPTFALPAYDGIGANEYVVQATHDVPGPDGKLIPALDFISTMDTDRKAEINMWYHTLNCGFRIKASGESDFPCIYGERVGVGRVYVKVDGPITWEKWVKGIADGRSYVSDGTTHLQEYAASVGEKKYALGVGGSEVRLDKPGKVKLTVQAASRLPGEPTVPVELIVNGYPVAKQDLKADGTERELTFEADVAKSSWVAVRVFPNAHTNPFFVLVDGKPIRTSKASADWCLRGVDQCWSMKKGTYKADEMKQAEADYEHARKVYAKIKEECAE